MVGGETDTIREMIPVGEIPIGFPLPEERPEEPKTHKDQMWRAAREMHLDGEAAHNHFSEGLAARLYAIRDEVAAIEKHGFDKTNIREQQQYEGNLAKLEAEFQILAKKLPRFVCEIR